jgi:hypothetical protein
MKRFALVGLAILVALIVAGFILPGYMDTSGATSVPGVGLLHRLPRAARILIEVVIGMPLAFGAALYVLTGVLELLSLLSWPLRKLVALARQR